MIQQMVQARACKKKGETVNYAEKVVENRRTYLQAKMEEEERQHMEVEGWQEREGEAR